MSSFRFYYLLRSKTFKTWNTHSAPEAHRSGQARVAAMMLRTFTLLLLCISVESQPELWIESNYPQAPWENITLWCKSPSRVSSKFLLLKDNTQMTWIRPPYKTFQVSFFIGALTESNTGLYRCCYWKEKGWSEPSKILELEAPGQLPKPIFWIQAETPPLPGCNVNIFCHGWLQDLVFMLFKEGYTEPIDYQVPTGTMAIFSIDNLAPENEGVYICRTHIQMVPTLWSEPSNPLKLVVAGGCGHGCWHLTIVIPGIMAG